ncbi:MAG TPA: amino acid adenylation domain-containing protein [Gemmatimonadaceae bacterium]
MTERRAPLSYGQELFWLLDSATPGLLAYNVPRAFRVTGPFDVDALERAVGDFVQRHEVLRSVYRQEGDQAVQVVVDGAVPPVERVDLSALPADAREAELTRALRERAAYHFDLAHDVLFRTTVFHLGEREHVLFTLTHHIVSDGWSKSVTFRELSELYAAHVEGRAPRLEPLTLQFGDFAKRQREALSGDALEGDLAYWREQLHGPLPVLDLPSDPNPAADPFAGEVRDVLLPAELVDAMRRLGQEYGATLYMVLLAAYQTLLHRYSGQDDIITGSPTAGREEEDTHDLVGYLAGALVLRNSFAGNPSFADLLQRVADTCLDAYEHQAVPFERLVLELQERKNLTHAPLFQCVLTMEDTVPAQLTFGTAKLAELEVGVAATKFNLVLLFSEQGGGLRLRLGFRTALISAARAERFLGHLRTLLEAAVARPGMAVSALPLLTAPERAQLDMWNATSVSEGEPTTLVALVEAQAARVPTRAAVIGQRTDASDATKVVELSYGSLDQLANQLAHQLRLLGAARNAPIGLLLDRSVESIVAVLGILKSGAAFMPLSVDAPPARLARQLAESGATIVVTDAAHAGQLPANVQSVALDRDAAALAVLPQSKPSVAVAPEDLAYVLFTSGSTGTPKGVAVTHANAVHYARAISRVLADVPARNPGDGIAALDGWTFGLASTLAADLGHTSLWPALLAGGTLHVLASAVTTEPARFAAYMTAHPLDVIKMTPGHLAALLGGKLEAELPALLPRRWTVVGGEALRPAVARLLVAGTRGRVLNHYGPTETTVGALTYAVTRERLDEIVARGTATVPLGWPLANGRAYVCDASGNEQPIGVPGELWLGGAGVAQGYLHRDELTADRFVTRDGERVYRTGDRATRLADGAIVFLGRTDDQVKVRGYRVELGEIEAMLQSHPSVAHGVVVLRVQDEIPSLVAYAVPKQGGYAASHAERPTAATLTAWLADQLPEYMVPSAVMVLDALPLTANGKVDRAALPAPEGDSAGEGRHVAPRTATEETVARIWRDVLKRDQVGVTDSFLDLGGHSLLAIRVLGRISKELGVRLALRALFDSPTVAQIAAIIDGELRQRNEAEALRQALAAVEALSEHDAQRLLADASGEAT